MAPVSHKLSSELIHLNRGVTDSAALSYLPEGKMDKKNKNMLKSITNIWNNISMLLSFFRIIFANIKNVLVH